MTHGAADMTRVKNPAKSFGGGIGNIDGGGDVYHANDTAGAPFLDCKMLDVNVARALGGAVLVNHSDGGLIILVEGCRARLRVAEFSKNGAEVFGDLGGVDGGNKLGLGGRGRNSGLKLGFVGDGAAGEGEDDAGDGAAFLISGVSGINISSELKRRGRRKSGEVRIDRR